MKQFTPVCTLPEAGPVFVSAPNVRSTLDIFWTCVSILILCSWSVLHLTIPEQFTPRNRRQRWNLWIARLAIKLQWTLITMLAPEIICGNAVSGWLSARRNTPSLQLFAEQDGVPWTKAHTSFADIGGFVLRFDNEENTVAPGTPDLMSRPDQTMELQQFSLRRPSHDRLRLWRNTFRAELKARTRSYGTLPWHPHKTHESQGAEALELVTARMDRRNQRVSTMVLMEGDTWVLTSDLLYKVRSSGLVRSLPHITQADLDDKNKGDIVVKALAIIQVLWMVCQVIIRATLGRPSSPLEIMAIAFAVTNFFFYLLSLDRSQNVTTPVYIRAQRAATADEMAAISSRLDVSGDWKLKISNIATPSYVKAQRSRSVLLRLFYEWAYSVAIIVGSLIFGGVHLLAWNSAFPSDIEKWLWRVSSLVTMVSPAISFSALLIAELDTTSLRLQSMTVIVGTGGLLFVLARLFMTVEAFRSLYYLPPENYVNTWAANIPHFG